MSGGWAKPHMDGDAPGLNSFGFVPAQRSSNMEWIQTIVGGPDWITTRTGTSGDGSDWAFTEKNGVNYAIQAEYNNFRFLDISKTDSCFSPATARPASMAGACAPIVSDMFCQGSQGDIVVHGDLLIRAHESAHNIPNGDLTRSCQTAGNENQRVGLFGYDTDGDSFTLTQNGQTTVPIVRGQNNTTAGISAALQGGNEQQQVILTGNDNPGDSFTLTSGANTTVPFVRGTNQTQAAIQNALQGISEVQTVALTSYDAGDSFTMTYNGGAASQPIVSGQNNTQQGIQNALQGGNEVQTITLTNFNPATANFQLRFNGGFAVSPVIGAGGLAYTAFNLDAALNGLSGFAGGAATSAVSNTGFTITFSGASANTNVNAVEVINVGGCPTCTVANRESARGGTAVAGWPAGGTVSVGAITTSFTLTFAGAHQGTNPGAVAITGGTGGATGIVTETTPGSAGILPAGTQASSTTPTDAGFTVTFAGLAANTDVASLSVTNPVDTGGAAVISGSVRETVKGTAGRPGWTTGGTATVSTLTDAGFNVVFAGTLAAVNVGPLTVTSLTPVAPGDPPDITSLVEELIPGSTGVSMRGVTVIDISDPANPREIKGVPMCGNTHTITKYYDDVSNKLFVMGTSGGSTAQPQWGLTCPAFTSPDGNGFTEVVEVPLDHPENSRVRPDLRFSVGGGGNCHDVNVFEELHFMATACSGGGNAQIIDLTHVAEPGGTDLMWAPPGFTWPGLQTVHSAAISWSGKYVYINGEPGGGSGGECSFSDDTVKPLIHILDRVTGNVVGQWALPRPQQESAQENCTSHTISLVPSLDRDLIAWSGYTAGVSIIDVTNPKAPREIAFVDQLYFPPGNSGAGCWTGYWYNDKLFCNELLYGAHVFTVNEPWWKQAMTFGELNPQTATKLIRCQVSFTGGPTKAKKAGTVNITVKVFGPADLQAAWGATAEVRAPGYFKSVKTGENGTVSVSGVKSTGKGKLTVTVPNMENMIGCSAPSKNIAKAATAKKAKKSTKAVKK